MKKINSFLTAVFIVALVGAGRVMAETESAPKGKSDEAHSGRLTKRAILEKLQLTSEQKQALRKNRAAYRKMAAEIKGQLEVKKVELESEMEKPQPDQAKIKKITEEIGALKGKKDYLNSNAKLELEKNILTPQQVEQLKALESQGNSSAEENL